MAAAEAAAERATIAALLLLGEALKTSDVGAHRGAIALAKTTGV